MLRRLLGNQKGGVLAFVMASMLFFLALVGMVADLGFVYLEHARLQNAVDAAALAGALSLPNKTDKATSNANLYYGQNLLPDDPNKKITLTPTYSNNSNQINIRVDGSADTYFLNGVGKFLKALGISSTDMSKMTITVYAAALVKTGASAAGHCFDYTIFSGSDFDMLPLNGSGLYVDGSVHSDDNLKINGANITVTGLAEAVAQINVNGTNIIIGSQSPNTGVHIDMPDYSSQIQASALIKLNGNQQYNGNGLNVTGNMFINGDFQMNGTTITGTGTILATGNIKNNGNNITHTGASGQVCYYSQNGDITINGNNITIDGILYAPKGAIHINGNNITINGRIVANTVQINGSGLRVNGAANPVTSLPTASGPTTVSLVPYYPTTPDQ